MTEYYSPFPAFRIIELEPQWVSHFDNTNWEIYNLGSWDSINTEWDSMHYFFMNFYN